MTYEKQGAGEWEREREREQGISPKGKSVQQPDTVLSRWSVLIMECICFCNEEHDHESCLWPNNVTVIIATHWTCTLKMLFSPTRNMHSIMHTIPCTLTPSKHTHPATRNFIAPLRNVFSQWAYTNLLKKKKANKLANQNNTGLSNTVEITWICVLNANRPLSNPLCLFFSASSLSVAPSLMTRWLHFCFALVWVATCEPPSGYNKAFKHRMEKKKMPFEWRWLQEL